MYSQNNHCTPCIDQFNTYSFFNSFITHWKSTANFHVCTISGSSPVLQITKLRMDHTKSYVLTFPSLTQLGSSAKLFKMTTLLQSCGIFGNNCRVLITVSFVQHSIKNKLSHFVTTIKLYVIIAYVTKCYLSCNSQTTH